MNDREALMAMLRRAEKLQAGHPGKHYDWLDIREGRTSVKIHAGMDDAVATFTFGEDGMLTHVCVDESNPGDPHERSRRRTLMRLPCGYAFRVKPFGLRDIAAIVLLASGTVLSVVNHLALGNLHWMDNLAFALILAGAALTAMEAFRRRT